MTQFADTAAVEAWDTWFRWRADNTLCDRTIDTTWRRVADAVAAFDGIDATLSANRLVDAFSKWQLLPDARLLRDAGTGTAIIDHEPLFAVLNVGAFVVAPHCGSARLDLQRIADTAALAVRLLDDALLSLSQQQGAPRNAVRVGLIGMADALNLLDLPYGSPQARQQAREVAAAIANGTLRGAIELARDRGAADCDREGLVFLWRERGTPVGLIDDALRWGVRHVQLTAIEPQQRLALLANAASDALDPLSHAPRPAAGGNTGGRRCPDFNINQPLSAQVELRAAMQPWIDTPIDYPLVSMIETSLAEVEAANRLARHHRLPELRIRRTG
jgi:ribonucleoside-diphosphate reductase alpha chain